MSFNHTHDGQPCYTQHCALPADPFPPPLVHSADYDRGGGYDRKDKRDQHRMSDHSHEGVACTRAPFWSCDDPRAKEQPMRKPTVRARMMEDDARFPKTPLVAGERLPGDHALPLAVVFNGSTGNLTLVCMMLMGVRGCQRTFAVDRIQDATDHVLDEHDG